MVLNKLTLFILIFSIQFTYSQKVNWISFEQAVELQKTNPKNIMMDVYTKWCGPCKMLTPILEELDKEYEGKIDIYKMDIEDEMEISQQFNVMSVPTLVFIPLEGKPAIQAGAPPKETLKEIIETKLLCSDTTEKINFRDL